MKNAILAVARAVSVPGTVFAKKIRFLVTTAREITNARLSFALFKSKKLESVR